MSTRALRSQTETKSARKAAKRARVQDEAPPDEATVAARLAKITAADMPWLSADIDMSPPDGLPETVGPPTYRRRRS